MLLRTFLLVLAALLMPLAARAQEAVLAFSSDISVGRDGVIDVVEQIRVRADQGVLREGLQRPFAIRESEGLRIELVSAVRDGAPERVAIDRSGWQVVMKLGDPGQPLASGQHDYVLHYRLHGAVSFDAQFDRLRWRVTPADWPLSILVAQATLHLPDGAPMSEHRSGITGGGRAADVIGQATGSDYKVDVVRPLRSGEALEVDVAWPRGFVTRPSRQALLSRQLRGQLHTVVAGLGLLAMLFCFGMLRLLARAARRDPVKEPLGPAMSRLVRHGVVDDVSLAATLIAMAGKGYLTIEHTETGAFLLQRTWKEGDLGLIPTDRAIAESLYRDRPSRFFVARENVDALRQAQMELRGALQREIERMSLRAGRLHYGAIALLQLIVLAATIQYSDADPLTAASAALLMLGGLLICYHRLCLRPSALSWQTGREHRGILVTLVDALSTRSTLLYAVAALTGFALLATAIGPLAALFLGIGGMLSVYTVHRLRAPARLGGRLEAAVGRDEAEMLEAQDASPQRYEAQLPLAVALGIESPWSRRFASLAEGSNSGYRPRWYSGFRESFTPDAFAPKLAHDLTKGIDDAIG